jgi:hypothetical protein
VTPDSSESSWLGLYYSRSYPVRLGNDFILLPTLEGLDNSTQGRHESTKYQFRNEE